MKKYLLLILLLIPGCATKPTCSLELEHWYIDSISAYEACRDDPSCYISKRDTLDYYRDTRNLQECYND